MPADYPNFGAFIRHRREELKLSLRALADKVDVSAAFLSDLEHGRRFPSDDKRDQLARALDLNPDELRERDSRVRADLKQWLETNPEVKNLLSEFQRSGRPAEELIAAWRRASRKKQ